MSMGIFTLSLGANESREAAISGEYFELRNALSPVVLIELLDRSGGVIARLDSPEQSDFVRPGRYETIRITNGPTAQTIKHFYGSGDAGSRRTSGVVTVLGTVGVTGDVSVIDGEKSRSLSGGAFVGNAYKDMVAAEFPQVQLWNPAGSGKNAIVGRLTLTSNTTQSFVVGSSTAPLLSSSGANRLGAKKLGGAAGVCQVRGQGAAAVNVGSILMNGYVTANKIEILEFSSPFVIAPGFGLLVQGGVVNSDFICNVEFFEESI